MMELKKLIQLSCVAIAFTLGGCGGGGGDDKSSSRPAGLPAFAGNSGAASITEGNAEAMAIAAGESINSVIAEPPLYLDLGSDDEMSPPEMSEGPAATGSAVFENISAIAEPSDSGIQPLAVVTEDVSSEMCVYGSATVSFPDDFDFESFEGAGTISIRYTNCRPGNGYSYDGQVDIYSDDFNDENAASVIVFRNYTVTYGQATETYNMIVECVEECIITADHGASDSLTHRIADAELLGNPYSGLDGTAVFYHETHGRVAMTLDGLTYGNCGRYPNGGALELRSGSALIEVVFNGDCSYSGDWSSNGDSGEFSGAVLD